MQIERSTEELIAQMEIAHYLWLDWHADNLEDKGHGLLEISGRSAAIGEKTKNVVVVRQNKNESDRPMTVLLSLLLNTCNRRESKRSKIHQRTCCSPSSSLSVASRLLGDPVFPFFSLLWEMGI